MKLTADDSKELARWFREMSVSLGDYRFSNWSKLSEKERSCIEDMEWTLLNYSSDFITQTVGLILDDTKVSLEDIQRATVKAKRVVVKVKTANKAIAIATSVIKLGAAIVTKDPGMIVSAISGVIEVATAEG